MSGTDSTYPFAERELTYTLEPGFISSGFREGAVLGEEDITDKALFLSEIFFPTFCLAASISRMGALLPYLLKFLIVSSARSLAS